MRRWEEDIIELGALGREARTRVERFEELNESLGLDRPEGSERIIDSKRCIIGRMREAGLEVRIDRAGNIFGRREGSNPGSGAVLSGSHLDSVRGGGMFDGTAGVVAALEAVRIMSDRGFRNTRPVEVCVFMGEEGSAFQEACLGSRALAGACLAEEVRRMRSADGRTLGQMYEGAGLIGTYAADLSGARAFVELHVEQGPVLDAGKVPLGIVERIAGISYLNVTVEGRSNHAGSTPMRLRADPLVASSELVLHCSRAAGKLARERGDTVVATVDCLRVYPSEPSVIPGRVELGIDIRDGDARVIARLRETIQRELRSLEGRYGVRATAETAMDYPPAQLDAELADRIEAIARKAGIRSRRMTSGAIHDAQSMAARVPTAMVFVPSRGGVSHSPFEWTEWEDLAGGIAVLSEALMELSA